MDFLKIIDMYGNEKLPKTPSKSIHEYSKSNDKENIVLLLKDADNKEKYLQSKDEYGATALHYGMLLLILLLHHYYITTTLPLLP